MRDPKKPAATISDFMPADREVIDEMGKAWENLHNYAEKQHGSD